MAVQFLIAAISPIRFHQYVNNPYDFMENSPCREGFPVKLFSLTPIQTRSPKPSLFVWFTMTVPNAANGHGEPLSSPKASLARRIQCARVAKGMLLMLSVGSAILAAAVTVAERAMRRVRERIVHGVRQFRDTFKACKYNNNFQALENPIERDLVIGYKSPMYHCNHNELAVRPVTAEDGRDDNDCAKHLQKLSKCNLIRYKGSTVC
jgi:hypothetical protein